MGCKEGLRRARSSEKAVAICLTSRTQRNPGTRFFTCALGKRELQCGFFKWVDEVKERVVQSDEDVWLCYYSFRVYVKV
ncbi:Zinc finger, GRF-type [Sesbania bispinosa]|nr:Zinc finger, GRF-type [Sesbania bispinosa]